MFSINDLSLPEVIGTKGLPVVEVSPILFASLVSLCCSEDYWECLSPKDFPVIFSAASYIRDNSVRNSVVDKLISLYVDATCESI